MKRTISLLVLIALVVSIFAACSAEETEPEFEIYRVSKEETTGFSYEKEAEAYLSDDVEFAGETEIKQDGFFNITRRDITDTFEAYERAKLECTISYDQVSIFYDCTLDMWKIYFFTKETDGNSGDRQLVYLGGDGVTRLIVNNK